MLSCRFLRQLTNLTEGRIVLLQTYSGPTEALEAVKEGRAWGLVSI
jgi:hypothetical protein